MVDLAKIRKKAKEKKEAGPPAPAPAASPGPEPPAKGVRGEGKTRERAKGGGEAPRAEPAASGAAPEAPAAQPPGGERVAERAPAKLERFRETAGRLSEVARPAAAAEGPAEAQLELLTFVLAGEQYAIDIERIAEIIAPRPATPVPNAPRPVVGIISLRGTIVTMLDLRRELGQQAPAAISPETRTIVVEEGGSLAGFTVDRVLRVVKVRPDQVRPHPVVSPAEQSDAVRGVFQAGAALTIVLDVEKLLARG